MLINIACLFVARGEWQLVWQDEFNSNALDSTHWTFDIGNGAGGWGNNELEYYTSRPQNVSISNGLLHIVALKESFSGFNYTSAKLKSSGLVYKKYGRFEFRARFPTGQGYWPALWMMPEDSVYGGWAVSGEIDIFENRGSNSLNVLGTIHFGGMYPNNTHSSGPSFNFSNGDSVTNFHVYALEWTTNAIRWYVDDTLYETQTFWWSSSNPTNTSIRNPFPAPFDQPFYMIMNLAVGGNFGGNPDASTQFPGEMQVDYVRVYDWIDVAAPPPILKLRVPLNDASGSSTTSSDKSQGGADVTLQMMNGAGVAADLHGLPGSGVGGPASGNRALDLSSNSAQPGNPGPVAAVTNSGALGFGVVSNFVVSLWLKQNGVMAPGANVGPRLFALGTNAPSDTGVANSIGLKFQTSDQLNFQIGSVTAPASFPSALPTNQWLFFAAIYDGSVVSLYQGSETNAVSLVSTTGAATSVDFGQAGALCIGNRQNLQRSFDGWIADLRFYTGRSDANFVETVRALGTMPSGGIAIKSWTTNVSLIWPGGVLQSSTNLGVGWSNLDGAVPPLMIAPTQSQQFFRVH
jgi:beta-glucanase (GH16 family)